MDSLGNLADLEITPFVQDNITEKIIPKLKEMCEQLKKAKKDGRFILLKFHNDADGISGALALTKMIRCRAYQQNGAIYTVKDAFRDLHILGNECKPLVVFLDFGMNKESEEGLKYLKAAAVDVIVIDHHKPTTDIQKIADLSVNPWEFQDQIQDVNPSIYVAGYLAVELARLCGLESEKALEYARIACAGDKSNLLQINEKDKEGALVLDYLAMNSSFGNNLEFYKNVMNKKELFQSISRQAQEKVSEAVNVLLRSDNKREANGITIYSFDIEKVIEKGEFPNRSKVTTGVFEHLNNEEEPIVVFGCGDKVLIMRANQKAVENGVDLAAIAKEMNEVMKDFVISGGGHMKAAAIRIRVGYVKSVVNAIIEKIEKN